MEKAHDALHRASPAGDRRGALEFAFKFDRFGSGFAAQLAGVRQQSAEEQTRGAPA
jgi:hypothetical protein